MAHGRKLGLGVFGGFSDFAIKRGDDGEIFFYWTVENYGQSEGMRVYIYRNGEFYDLSDTDQWSYAPGSDESRWKFDLIVFPRSGRWQLYRHIWPVNLYNRLSISWTLPEGPVDKIYLYKSPDHSGTVDTDTAYKKLLTPGPRMVGTTKAEASGKWVGIERTATFEFEVTLSGDPEDGTGEVSWTWGSITGTLVPQTYPQIVANGIKISFSEALSEGETFQLVVGFPTSAITKALGNGSHTFSVGTFNGPLESISAELTETVYAVPIAPLLSDYTYVDGSGEVTVDFQIPSDPEIRQARIYRNYPGTWEVCGWRSIQRHAVTPAQVLRVTVDDLRAGLNRILCRCWNNGAHDENFEYFEIELDAALNEIATPSPPSYVDAYVDTDGVGVIFETEADDTSDQVNFYANDGAGGAIDYTTAIGSVVNPQTSGRNKLTTTLYLADGTWSIAARAEKTGYEEKNEFVTATVEFDRTFPPVATGLAGVLV